MPLLYHIICFLTTLLLAPARRSNIFPFAVADCYLACLVEGMTKLCRTTKANLHAKASLRDLMSERLQQFAAKVFTHPLFDFLSRQQPRRFDDGSLTMNPFRLDPVEPWAFNG